MKRALLMTVVLLVLLPGIAKAQWTFDIVSVEAYINDHKKQRSLLLARSTLEYSNKLLHEYSRKEIGEYKELNVDLDRYTRAFDVIDVMYQSLRTVLNVKSTYTAVSDRIGDYKKLLEDFNERIVKRGRIDPGDAVILAINEKAIRDIATTGAALQVGERPCAVCHRGGGLLDLRPAAGTGSGEHVAGRHRATPEPGVYRDMAVHTGAYRLLESEDLPSQGQGDYRRSFRTMAQSGTAGLLMNDERERRQTIYRLEFDFHAIDIGK